MKKEFRKNIKHVDPAVRSINNITPSGAREVSNLQNATTIPLDF